MTGKKSDLGPIGASMAHTVRQLREARHLGYAELSRRLAELGREIPSLGLRRLEAGERRVDADDLVALALALDVSPATLLMPAAADDTERVDVTGVAKCDADRLWSWLSAQAPIEPDVHVIEFRLAALPPWKKRQLLAALVSRQRGEHGCRGQPPDQGPSQEKRSNGDHQQVRNIRRCNALRGPLPHTRTPADPQARVRHEARRRRLSPTRVEVDEGAANMWRRRWAARRSASWCPAGWTVSSSPARRRTATGWSPRGGCTSSRAGGRSAVGRCGLYSDVEAWIAAMIRAAPVRRQCARHTECCRASSPTR